MICQLYLLNIRGILHCPHVKWDVAYDGDNISKTNTFIVIILFSHVGKISMLLAMYSRFLATYLIKKQADPIVVLWHLKRLCILDTILAITRSTNFTTLASIHISYANLIITIFGKTKSNYKILAICFLYRFCNLYLCRINLIT